MPPRVRLNEAEAARLPSLLALRIDGASFAGCHTHPERVLWVLGAYGEADEAPLTPALITMLVFEQGTNLALATVTAAITEAAAAGWVAREPDGGVTLTPSGSARAAELRPLAG